MKNIEIHKIIDIIKLSAKLIPQNPTEITIKNNNSLITPTDKELENNIIEKLNNLPIDADIMSEEIGYINNNKKYCWVIDPLDGTANYINGFRYASSIALVDKETKEILLGVVYNIKDDIIYYAIKGKGSYVIKDGTEERLILKKSNHNYNAAIIGFPYNESKLNKILDILRILYRNYKSVLRIGPASLDICTVAEGRAKMYVELDLEPWDIAAGLLVLKEAGGAFERFGDLFVFSWDEGVNIL